MKIGYQVAYMMTSPNGAVTHNVERYVTQVAGGEWESLQECREMAEWTRDNFKDSPHIEAVTLKAIHDDQGGDLPDHETVMLEPPHRR